MEELKLEDEEGMSVKLELSEDDSFTGKSIKIEVIPNYASYFMFELAEKDSIKFFELVKELEKRFKEL